MGPQANWCSFATWASKQAGQTIRQQDLQQLLKEMIRQEPELEAALSLMIMLAKKAGAEQSVEQLRQSALATMLASSSLRASQAISRGNKKVFEEIGREFSRFMITCINDTVYDAGHISSFCKSLKPGPPPAGQDYLAQAFTCYYKALFTYDAREKAELNLLANLLIGFHEQNRLQPEIAEALNASVDKEKIKKQLLDILLTGIHFRSRVLLFLKRMAGSTGLLEQAIEAWIGRMQFHIRKLLTAQLMTLTIPPNNRLQLGRDLAFPYPENLTQLVNKDLLALLQQTDPTPDSLLESGATDWASLPERMHFIGELFRCCQQKKELLDAPFTPGQQASLKSGRIPEGNL